MLNYKKYYQFVGKSRLDYGKDSLEKLIQKVGFEIESAFGGNRRDYVNVSDARDAFLYVCKKSN